MSKNLARRAVGAPSKQPVSRLDRSNETGFSRPTIEAYGDLEGGYDFFNEYLFVRKFDVRLPNVMLTMPKHKRYQGYFQHRSWGSAAGRHVCASEIVLNPEFFDSLQEVCQTLVHEMVHLAQAEFPEVFGKPSPRAYHNRDFARSMIKVGLMPSSTGLPGGKMTGVGMREYVIAGGPFARAYEQFVRNGYEIRWSSSFVRNIPPDSASGPGNRGNAQGSAQDRERDQKRRSKTKYPCAACGLNAWAKPQVKLACVTCSTLMQEVRS